MIYCDTSLIIAALTPEVDSQPVLAWLERQPSGDLCISGWVLAEVASALSMKVRHRQLAIDERARVRSAWQRMQTEALTMIACDPTMFDRAADIAGRHELHIRAGDALHLAIALAGGHALAGFDLDMIAAASALGIPVEAIA